MNRDASHELQVLIDALLDGRADADQQARLQMILRDDPEAQLWYLRYVNLHSCLRMTAASPIQASGSESPSEEPPVAGGVGSCVPIHRERRRLQIGVALAALAATLLLAVWGWMHQLPRPEPDGPPARVVEVRGQLEVLAQDGTARPVMAGDAIARGQTLRSGDSASSAVIERAGAPIELGANTFISFAGLAAEEVQLTRGGAHFKAGPQPLLVRTPHAEIRSESAALTLAVTDGSTRVSVHGGTAQLVRTADRQAVSIPSDAWVVAGRDVGPLVAHPYEKRPPTAIIPTRHAVEAALSPNGTQLALFTSRIELWDVTSRKLLLTLAERKSRLNELGFSPDGRLLARGGQSPFLELWNLDDQQATRTFAVPRAKEEAIAPTFSADGKYLAALAHLPGNIQGVRTWRLADGAVMPEPARSRKLKSLVALPGTSSFVGGTGEGDLMRWHAATGAEEATYQSGQRFAIKHLAASGDGRWLAHPAQDGILIWDVAARKPKHLLDGTGKLAFSPDGRWLAAAFLGYLDVWNVATGARALTIPTERDGMIWLAFTPDGKTLLALSGVQGRILLWRLPELS
ncbi:MAG: FecR domain-containing protein [Planctomycetia bacterium]|nr:FecR domain-containing protein [Planctomycetia bacterium]